MSNYLTDPSGNILKDAFDNRLIYGLTAPPPEIAFHYHKISSPPVLPGGVSLQAIDGETMTSTTVMSNNYYSRIGATIAVNATNAPSWDDINFYPIGCWFGRLEITPGDFTTYVDLGLNYAIPPTGASLTTPYVNNSHIWYIDGETKTNFNASFCAGVNMVDEPQDVATISNAFTARGASWLNGRFTNVGFQHAQFRADECGGTDLSVLFAPGHFPIGGGVNRGIDTTSADMYWFAGSGAASGPGGQQVGGWIAGNPRSTSNPPLTADQMARGSNYGNTIDIMRHWTTGTTPAGRDSSPVNTPSSVPLWGIVENGNSLLTDTGVRFSTPDECQWGIWASIIHGARSVLYFYYQPNWGAPGDPQYDKAKICDGLIQHIAPVLNSASALNFVTPSLLGYVFPNYNQANFLRTGIHCIAKYYNGKFYIIACTSYGQSGYTTKTCTFTIPSYGATIAREIRASISGGAVVFDETRTIAISGGTQFTDTFANAYDVHIYRIE